MSGQSFRFLHTSNFRLHEPIRGVPDASESFRSLLAEAPFNSAANVISTALSEEVDFVVIAGDLVDPVAAGPRAITFLRDQFAKLSESEISVYWAASEADAKGGWLSTVDWPENVHIFSSEQAERGVAVRGDTQIAELVGRSWHDRRPFRVNEFESSSRELFRIAVVPEKLEIPASQTIANYWALGGSAFAATPQDDMCVVHYPGSIQGISPAESGMHGATVVAVDADGTMRSRMIATDAVRWCHERVPVSLAISRQEARQVIQARVKHLIGEIAKPMLVVWTITGENRFDTLFVQEEDRDEMLEWLREEYGEVSNPLWSVSIDLEPPEYLPSEWCEEDSILGDYLRVVQKYESSPELQLGLDANLDGTPPKELLAALSQLGQGERRQLLQSAALLGADLLRGDESPGP